MQPHWRRFVLWTLGLWLQMVRYATTKSILSRVYHIRNASCRCRSYCSLLTVDILYLRRPPTSRLRYRSTHVLRTWCSSPKTWQTAEICSVGKRSLCGAYYRGPIFLLPLDYRLARLFLRGVCAWDFSYCSALSRPWKHCCRKHQQVRIIRPSVAASFFFLRCKLYLESQLLKSHVIQLNAYPKAETLTSNSSIGFVSLC